VLNGSPARACFFAALTAARYAGERKGRPAILIPNPFLSRLRPPARARRAARRFICRPRSPTDFSPTSMRSMIATLARTVAIFIARRQIRKARWPRALFRAPEAISRSFRLHDF